MPAGPHRVTDQAERQIRGNPQPVRHSRAPVRRFTPLITTRVPDGHTPSPSALPLNNNLAGEQPGRQKRARACSRISGLFAGQRFTGFSLTGQLQDALAEHARRDRLGQDSIRTGFTRLFGQVFHTRRRQQDER